MSQNSTSKILGKLSADGMITAQPEENLHPETKDIGEVLDSPQLTPSMGHKMKDAVLNILGPKISNRLSPLDNK